MDFSISPEIEGIRQRINTFVTEQLLPVEADRANYDEHENIRDERAGSRCAPRRAPPACGRRRCRRSAAAWDCRWSAWRPATRR